MARQVTEAFVFDGADWLPIWPGQRTGPGTGGMEPYDVIVGLIQSNIRGGAIDYDSVADQYNDARVAMWNWQSSSIASAIEPLNTRDTGTGMGAMNTFVKDYLGGSLVAGRRILVVNAARGGTGLTTPSTNAEGANFTWNSDGPHDANNLGRSTVAALQNIMALLPQGSRIVAYLANHGSTDGSNATPKATFKTLATNWINYLRSTTNTTDVPYLMMQMRPSLLLENRHNIIDQGQQELATELANVGYAFSPNGAEYNRADSVHFNALGVRVIGHALYEAYQSLISPGGESEPEFAGALPLGEAVYEIPSTNTIFVAPSGNNANPGSIGAPKQTVAAALSVAASAGTTIVVRAGEYREDLGTINKAVTIQNYPGEAVWFDGLRVASSWTQVGSVWQTAYTLVLDRFAPQPGTNPLRNYSDQCWIDGQPLTQVADNTAAPGPGQFSVNQADGWMRIGTNPTGHTVEVSQHRMCGVITAQVNFLGLGFRRYSPDAMEWLHTILTFAGDSQGSIVENCFLQQSAMDAIHVTKSDIKIRSCTIQDVGHTGLGVGRSDNVEIDRVIIRRFNQGGWQAEPTCAGMKLVRLYAPRVTHCYIENGPAAYGIWFDISCAAGVIAGNRVVGGGTMKRGIEVELSDGGTVYGVQDKTLVVGNHVTGFTHDGILLFNSGNARVWNNTVGNTSVAIHLWQDERQNPNENDNNDTRWSRHKMPWHTVANEIVNNNVAAGISHNLQVAAYDDGGTVNLLGADMISRLAGNQFVQAPPGSMVQLGRLGGARNSYNSFAALAAAGADVGGPLGAKLGTNRIGASPADSTVADPLPTEIAALLGVPTGTRLVGANLANIPVPRT